MQIYDVVNIDIKTLSSKQKFSKDTSRKIFKYYSCFMNSR